MTITQSRVVKEAAQPQKIVSISAGGIEKNWRIGQKSVLEKRRGERWVMGEAER